MNLKDINSTIDFCKNRIKYYEGIKIDNKSKSTKQGGFNGFTHTKIKKHLSHFETAIEALEIVRNALEKHAIQKQKVIDDNSIYDF